MNQPRSGGVAAARGVIRRFVDDFFVDERLGFSPDGAGEHLLVQVEKTSANTAWVAEQLARFASVRPRDVGFAGRKDRHAVARQWFSIWLPGTANPDFSDCKIEGVTILATHRHLRKLRAGALSGNRFKIIVRELDGDRAALERRLQTASTEGVPNYFGEQRFGRDASNLQRARDWFDGRIRLRGTNRSMALSAARSALFNAVLAERVKTGIWHTAIAGDALNLDGSGGFFHCGEPDDEIRQRLETGDIHVTGPLWGEGEPLVSDAAAELERRVVATEPALVAGLSQARLKHQRRALRVMPRSFQWQFGEDTLRLEFVLPRGTFATSVLSELLDLSTATPTTNTLDAAVASRD